MANTSRDTFSDQKNYKRVVHQIGQPVVDNELNEAQDILLVEAVEGSAATLSALRAVDPASGLYGGLRWGYARAQEWLVVGTGGVDMSIFAGTLHVDGFRLVLNATTPISALGVTFAAGPLVSDTYGWIYADIVITEVGSGTDPDIAQSLIGETTLREKLSVTFGKIESTVSFEAAYNALASLPAATDPRIWKNNTARVFLCRYLRPAGSSNILGSYVFDLRQALPSDRDLKSLPFLKTIRSNTSVATEGTGTSDGMIVWDATSGQLQIGVSNGAATNDALEIGCLLTTPKAPDHYFAQPSDQVWALTGAGTADGSPRTFDSSFGWLLSADGDCLGFLTHGQTVNRRGQRLTKKGTNNESPRLAVYDYDAGALTGYTPNQLTVQKLVVAAVDDFHGDPGSFVVVVRRGNDLIWCDGTVTRGDLNKPVFEELGGTPTPWTAVVGSEGKNHAGLIDGLERVLNYSSFGQGSGDFSNGADGKVGRFFVRRGEYQFARGVHTYGTNSEITGQNVVWDPLNTLIDIQGEGFNLTLLRFHNPEGATRSASNIGVIQLTANTVSLRGLSFFQVQDATYPGSYYFIEGVNVVLEDCYFAGPVYIRANRVTINNCQFVNMGNTANLFPATVAGNPMIAQHVLLEPLVTGVGLPINWSITNSYFNIGLSAGTHASVLMNLISDPAGLHTVEIRNNVFDYKASSPSTVVPAIHVGGQYGDVEIAHNKFLGSLGVAKAGNVAADVVPFNGNYNGAPLQQGLASSQIYALGYVSMTRGRARSSSTHIHRNYFDMSKVASGGVTGRFVLWGACMAVFNYITVGSVPSVEYANIRYEHNTHNMRSDTAWGSAGANPQIATWGFYLAPTWQDSSLITSLNVDDIFVESNSFLLGGESTLNAAHTWRSIIAADLNSWPVSGGFLTDTTSLISVVLKNGSSGATTWSGRFGNHIHISDNHIAQAVLSGSSIHVLDQVPLATTSAHPRWAFEPIVVDAGGYPTATVVAPEGAGPRYYLGAFVAPTQHATTGVRIKGNRIIAPIYTSTGPNNYAAIRLVGSFHPIISGNQVHLSGTDSAPSANSFAGVRGQGTKQMLVTGNVFQCIAGAVGSGAGVDTAVGNVFRGCQVAFGGVDYAYTGGAAGDNIVS